MTSRTVRDRRAEVARLVRVLRHAQDAGSFKWSSESARWWVLVTVSQLNIVLHAPPPIREPRSR